MKNAGYLTNFLLAVIATALIALVLKPTAAPDALNSAGPGTVVTLKDGELHLWRLRTDTSDPARRMKLTLEDRVTVP